MAITVASIQNYVNQYIRDTSTNSVSANDRLRAISEACKELHTEMGLDISDRKYNLSFLDEVIYYDISTDVPTMLEPVDVRHPDGSTHVDSEPFFRKDPEEFYLETINPEGNAFTIERLDRKVYLGINHTAQYPAVTIHNCDTYDGNGTWTVDSTNSDATNITTDTVEFKKGSGSVNFDIDVSQSGNNKATIYNSDFSALDLTNYNDLGSLVCWIYIPDATYFTSLTGYWGEDSTNYWSATVTTDKDSNAWVDGWNRAKIDWANTTKTGSPDITAIGYLQFDFNYNASQGDDTDYRIDNIIMSRPETLEFHYQSWAIGETSTSNSALITEFTATTNVPFFSGVYDFLDKYVAHKAAAILFREMMMKDDAIFEDNEAEKEKKRLGNRFPKSTKKRQRNFKIFGI